MTIDRSQATQVGTDKEPTVSDNLNTIRNRLELDIDQLESIVQRITGPRPIEEVQGGPPSPSQVSTIHHIFVKLSQIDELIHELLRVI
jgi:hypothetical protein